MRLLLQELGQRQEAAGASPLPQAGYNPRAAPSKIGPSSSAAAGAAPGERGGAHVAAQGLEHPRRCPPVPWHMPRVRMRDRGAEPPPPDWRGMAGSVGLRQVTPPRGGGWVSGGGWSAQESFRHAWRQGCRVYGNYRICTVMSTLVGRAISYNKTCIQTRDKFRGS